MTRDACLFGVYCGTTVRVEIEHMSAPFNQGCRGGYSSKRLSRLNCYHVLKYRVPLSILTVGCLYRPLSPSPPLPFSRLCLKPFSLQDTRFSSGNTFTNSGSSTQRANRTRVMTGRPVCKAVCPTPTPRGEAPTPTRYMAVITGMLAGTTEPATPMP